MNAQQFQAWGEGAPVVMMDWGFVLALACALAVFAVRAFRRRLTVADFVIVGLTFGSSALVFALGWMAQHQFVTFWRYHYPGYVLAIGYVAHAGAVLCGRWRRAAALLAVGAAAVWTLVGGIQAVRHAVKYERHAADNWKACDAWAAEVIRNDWKGPDRCAREPLDPDFYISDYLPLVFAHTARTSYAAHARTVTVYRHVIAGRERMPDYFVLFDHEEKDVFDGDPERNVKPFYPGVARETVAERKTRYGTFRVYRTVKGKKGGTQP